MKTYIYKAVTLLALTVQYVGPQTIDQVILAAKYSSPPALEDYDRADFDDDDHISNAPSGEEHRAVRVEWPGLPGFPGLLSESGDDSVKADEVDGKLRPHRWHECSDAMESIEKPSTEPTSDTVTVEYDMVFKRDVWVRMQATRLRSKRKAVIPGLYKLANQEQFVTRWTNNEIPYQIDRGFSSIDESQIISAMSDWQMVTCLSFRPKTASDTNYINIAGGSGCASRVGMAGDGPQTLTLGSGCRQKNIVIHELGHAIGFFHEQNRPDRDQHVTIHSNNIKEGEEEQFNIFSTSVINNHNIPYDYLSIMHYGAYFSSARGCKTIVTKDQRYQHRIGKSEELSFSDIKLANLMYTCNAGCEPRTCPSEGFQGKDCKCWCKGNPIRECEGADNIVDATFLGVDTRRDKDPKCSHWASTGECEGNPLWMIPNCPVSCDNCAYDDSRDSEYRQLPERMSWIGAGPAGVFGRRPNSKVYYLKNSRGVVHPSEQLLQNQIWEEIGGRFKQITVGTDLIAGVTRVNRIWFRRGIQDGYPRGRYWERSRGRWKSIVLSEHIDQLWGIDNNGILWYMPGVTAAKRGGIGVYQQQNDCLDVGISKYGIWILKTDNTVLYRNHSGTTRTSGTNDGWNMIKSGILLKQLSAEGSERWVVAVDISGQFYIRSGITTSTPMGTSWKRIDFEFGSISQVSIYKDQMWLTTSDGKVYTRRLLETWLT